MPRRPRLHVPGALYHVILRGNGRQPIFFDDADRRLWESLIDEGLQRHRHRIHAYCWMSNHVHIALQGATDPLAGFIGTMASSYARATNRKTGRSGHLFERRFRAILVQAESHLKELIRYIHLNPVRAGLVADPAGHRWSSHRAYLGDGAPAWLTVDWVLSQFGQTAAHARRRYADFMRTPADEETWRGLRSGGADDNRVLGDDQFSRTIVTAELQPRVALSLDDLVREACQRNGIAEADLASPARGRREARVRAEIGLAAVEGRVATVADIARRLGRSPSSTCQAINRLRVRRRISQ